MNWRRDIIIVLMAGLIGSAMGAAGAADQVFYVDGRATTGGDGSETQPWNSLAHALRQAGSYPREDHITLRLRNGPFHLAEGNGRTLRWSGYDRPYLTLERDPLAADPVWITGIAPRDAIPLESTSPSEYSGPWPANDPAYDFGWITVDGEPLDSTSLASSRYADASGTLNWLRENLLHLDKLRRGPGGGRIPQNGAYLLRREALFLVDTSGAELRIRRFAQLDTEPFRTLRDSVWQYTVDTRRPYTDRRITLRVPASVDLATSSAGVYVPRLAQLLRIDHCRGVTLRGLGFALSSGDYQQAMVQILHVETAVIDDCEFAYSGGRGLQVGHSAAVWRDGEYHLDRNAGSDRISLLGVRSHHNGTNGVNIGHSIGLRMVDCELTRNNLRGYRAGTMAWELAGAKLFRVKNILVTNLRSHANLANGFWIDNNGRNVTFTNCRFENNLFRGFFLENNPGPTVFDKCAFINNALNTNPYVDAYSLPGSGRTSAFEVKRGNLCLGASDNIYLLNCRLEQTRAENIPLINVPKVDKVIPDVYAWKNLRNAPEYTVQTHLVRMNNDSLRVDRANPWFGFSRYVTDEEKCSFWRSLDVRDLQWTSDGRSWSAQPPAEVTRAIEDCR